MKTDLRPGEHVTRVVTNQRIDLILLTNQVYCDMAHALVSPVGTSQLQLLSSCTNALNVSVYFFTCMV